MSVRACAVLTTYSRNAARAKLRVLPRPAFEPPIEGLRARCADPRGRDQRRSSRHLCAADPACLVSSTTIFEFGSHKTRWHLRLPCIGAPPCVVAPGVAVTGAPTSQWPSAPPRDGIRFPHEPGPDRRPAPRQGAAV